ncbi:MAG: DUF1549 and DUF1553 domain-containing protein [Limisphaerales bacterium]
MKTWTLILNRSKLWFAGSVFLAIALSKISASETLWSLKPLVRPALPQPSITNESNNPIDWFVNHRQVQQGLKSSPRASHRQLLRRVFNDVWGLPPLYEDLEWLNETGMEKGWAQLVDRLLGSPHYGERWARHWMDVIHFAETHGHDEDAPREHAWPYRDYLIQSFNNDKPYAQFAREQIAGDAMRPENAESLIGTGFLAAGPWDESSQMGIQDGTLDKKVAQYLDRDDMITTTMSTFLGLTVHCARCHDHKFDPISIEDYYSLQAVFAGVDRNNRPFDRDNDIHQKRQTLLSQKTDLLANRYPEGELLNQHAKARIDRWNDSRQSVLDRWTFSVPDFAEESASKASFQPKDHSLFFPKPTSDQGLLAWTFSSPYTKPTAIQLEVLPDDRLPNQGPGWASNGNFRLSEFKVFTRPDPTTPWVQVPLQQPQNDFSEHSTSVRYLIDNDNETTWGILPQTGTAHRCFFELSPETLIQKGGQIKIELQHYHKEALWIGRCRVSLTDAARQDIQPFLEAELDKAFSTPEDQRTRVQQLTLSRHATLEHWNQKLNELPPASQVYAATSFFDSAGNFKPSLGPREVRKLIRGEIQSPREIMLPGALSQLKDIPWNPDERELSQESERRLTLAEWISHPRNGLFWRSMANRIWQHHFGSPLAGTPNDLGHSGQAPTHPELLDWLACELRDSNGSLKHLHRLILNSSTYQQSATFRDAAAEIDASNQYYWRMSPRRLDAESFRDTLLALSQDLATEMGGPSVKQFNMRPGIHVTPIVDYKGFAPGESAMTRRSIYRFLFRTLPDPFMQAMDCPDASSWTPKRTVSMGPLQALALMNDEFVIYMGQRLSETLNQDYAKVPSSITALFRKALLRDPTPEEMLIFSEYTSQHSLANACRFLFNSNAFMFIE